MPTAALITLGCRVNQYDTQAIRELLEEQNFQIVPFQQQADIYIINTCTVTAAADVEGVMLIRRAKKLAPQSRILVTGCLAQDQPEKVAAIEGVDLVISNNEKFKIATKIQHWFPAPNQSELVEDPHWIHGISKFAGHQRAFVKVQDGCQFHCTFCLIPRVRGKNISRPVESIVDEVHRLVDQAFHEIVLTGIQLASYGRDWGLSRTEPRLSLLIRELLKIQGLHRIRLSSYSIADFEMQLLEYMHSQKGICPHLHLPLQSGDAGVLKHMQRPYTISQFARVVETVRKKIPEIHLTSDIIVGFPGETDDAFNQTLSQIREFQFNDFHPFPYSTRAKTKAKLFENQVSSKIIHERMNRLLSMKKQCVRQSLEKSVGKKFWMVVEHYNHHQMAGLSPWGERFIIDSEDALQIGHEVFVQSITKPGSIIGLAKPIQ